MKDQDAPELGFLLAFLRAVYDVRPIKNPDGAVNDLEQFEPSRGSDPAVLAAVAEAARAGAAVALLPTTSTTASGYPSYDGLVGYNSDPDAEKTGVPTLLVPGRAADRIQEYGADVDFTARTIPARSYCLTGWFGTRKPISDPIVVTTP